MGKGTIEQADELAGLSRTLFDKAVCYWYTAMGLELSGGILAAIIGLADPSTKSSIVFAIIGFILVAVAYALKINFSTTYDHAETMRRQSVFSRALNWPIGKMQFSEWRRIAGGSLERTSPIPDDYFATKEPVSPLRLLEMTQESAFWTRHLYCYLRKWVCVVFIISILCLVFALSTASLINQSIGLKVVYGIYLLLPLVLTVDSLGWAIKLGQLISSLSTIENDLEKLSENNHQKPVEESAVLRIVAEYNCQVVSGFPVPSFFFNSHHDRIQSLWDKR